MEHFTPWSSLVGGTLIGLSAALLLATNGRIAGISGILGGLLSPWGEDRGWRITFLVGLVAGCALARAVTGGGPEVQMIVGVPALIVAGLLVGVGTRVGNGCTSGHGVCGMARFSPRSLVATLTFMFTGGLTVFLVRHMIGG